MALPKPLLVFFTTILILTQESTVPDLRKYVIADKNEAPKHYFDMENFVDSFPQNMAEAKKKYDDKFLSKMELCHGTFKK
jgi:hypothetical protein